MTERTIKPDEKEYKKLETVAKVLELFSEHNAKYIVKDVYLDYGQDWMWTTICRRGWHDCQVLSPRDWKEIMAIENENDLALVVSRIRTGKYFND